MNRAVRIAMIAVLAAAGLVALVFALAWSLMPRDWIDRQARIQVSQVKGAAVRWTRMTPAFKGLSIGVNLEGLAIRVPATGDPRTDLRANEVFVRMKLIPLLFRRVEVSSAKLDGAWITMYEQPPQPEAAVESIPAPRFRIQVPRFDFHNLNVRTRDAAGSGTELKGLEGNVELKGSFDAPTAIQVSAKAESLYWKPSAAAASVPLPSPLALDAALESRAGSGILKVTRGSLDVGPLTSAVTGTVRFPKRETGASGAAEVDLRLTGKPQKLDSGDRVFRAVSGSLPAKWEGTASWDIHAGGRAPGIVTDGTLLVSGLSVRAKENAFLINQVRTVWKTRADRTFTATGSGAGSGVSLDFAAKGLLAPGGSTTGTLVLRAPATRLNGLLPNTPTWRSGNLECRVSFELRPPAKPTVHWFIRGSGMDGTVQGLAHPVRGLQFDADGTEAGANVRSLKARVGSSSMNVSGTLTAGKPLSTGTFRIALDRFVAEEWAPPVGNKAPTKVVAPPPTKLPVPIGAFTGLVEIGEARSGGMRATNISTPVRYDGKDLVAQPIKGAIGTGTFEGSLNIKRPFEKPSYALHMDVKRAPVEQVAAGTIPFSSAVTGFMSGVVDLTGEGLPSARPNDTLKGLLKGSLEDGRVKVSPTLIAIARSLGITQQSDVPVTKASHTVRIVGNKLVIDQARGDLGEDKAEMTGSVGLDHVLDLNLLLRLAPNRVKGSTVLAKLAQYARDSEGRLPVVVKITGLDRAPKITINTQQLMETATKQLGKKVGEKLVSDLVKGLARRPDSVRALDSTLAADSVRNLATSPKTPADSTAADPLKKTRDALKNIFRK